MNQRASYRQYGSSRPFISSVSYLEWLIHFDSNEDVPGQSRMHCRCAMDQYSISTLLIQTFGWGTGIRTQTDGFRGQRVLETLVLTITLFPKNWCSKWDSNPHAFRHKNLNLACSANSIIRACSLRQLPLLVEI